LVGVEVVCEDERVERGILVRPVESALFEMAREYGAVVADVVGDEAVAGESIEDVLCDFAERFFVFDVILSDSGEFDDLFGDFAFGVDHPVEDFDDLSAFEKDDTDFDDLAG